MLIKLVTLFLVGMVALAFVGKFRIGLGKGRDPILPPHPAKCAQCGRYLIGAGPCDCTGTKS